MSLKEMKNYTFSHQAYEDWVNKAEESLKGKKVSSLYRNTYEEILLKPLYTKEDVKEIEVTSYPGIGSKRRGNNAGGYIGKPWKIAQQLDIDDPEEFSVRLASSFEKGQSAIAFKPSINIVKNLTELIKDAYERFPFCINGAIVHSEIIEALTGLTNKEAVTGFIAKDPVSLYATETGKKENIIAAYDRLSKTMQKAAENFPYLKTLSVDTSSYHNAGANAVQELAITIATMVQHMEQLKTCGGMEIDDIVLKTIFHFAIGQNFFMEVAKLRAARVLLEMIFDAYDVSENTRDKVEFSAETSKFTKTIYDPYVNLLRAGNEAFAAVLGGVQYLHVSPYDESSGTVTEFSDRVARNIQLILKEEAGMGKVIDPAGGSWYIESLTDELVEKAWSLFLEIEEKGGIVESLNIGWLQKQISEVKEKRESDIFTRKQSIVGVNKYALLDDNPLTFVVNHEKPSYSDEWFEPIIETRLSVPFEILRKRSEVLFQKGNSSFIGLLCIGKLKNHKLRADFITDFFAPGGVIAKKSNELETIDEAISYIQDTKYNHYVICGSDEDYKQWNIPLLKQLKKEFPKIKWFLAGLPEDEEQKNLTENGISRFIHLKSNCYEELHEILTEMEVE